LFEKIVRSYRFFAVLLLVAGLVASAGATRHKNDTGRLLTGKVFNHQNQSLPDAIVYLTDTRTREVKTYIVSSNGTYSFPALSPNVDYEIYAEYKGHKSDTKTLSQFDDRSYVTINLRVDMK
jgi:Carboxypeptidase regulatory-like domain